MLSDRHAGFYREVRRKPPLSLISRVVAAHLARIGIDVAPSEEPA